MPRKSRVISRPPIPPTRSRRSIRSRASRGSRGGIRKRSIESARFWSRRISSITGSPARLRPTASLIRATTVCEPPGGRSRIGSNAAFVSLHCPGWRRGSCRAASPTGDRHGAASPEFRCSPARWTHGHPRWARVRSHAGQGYDIAGTSEVAGLITPARADVSGLVSLLWGEKVWQIGGPTQAGADSVSWCHRTLRVRGTLAAAVERAGMMSPTETRPLFLPYLAGERTPLWRADVRGAFEGLAREHHADDLLWAVLEGVAMAMRDILARAVKGSGGRAVRGSRWGRRRTIERLVPDQGGCHERAHGSHIAPRDGRDRRRHRRRSRVGLASDPRRRGKRDVSR